MVLSRLLQSLHLVTDTWYHPHPGTCHTPVAANSKMVVRCRSGDSYISAYTLDEGFYLKVIVTRKPTDFTFFTQLEYHAKTEDRLRGVNAGMAS